MALPGSFPAWLSSPGQPDAVIFDATGYNAATAQGYVYPVATATANANPFAVAAGQPITPLKVVSAQLTITPVSLNLEQNDGSKVKTKAK